MLKYKRLYFITQCNLPVLVKLLYKITNGRRLCLFLYEKLIDQRTDGHTVSNNQPVNQSVSQASTNQQVSQPANKPVSQTANQPVNQIANEPVKQPVYQSVKQPINRPFKRPINHAVPASQTASHSSSQSTSQSITQSVSQPINQWVPVSQSVTPSVIYIGPLRVADDLIGSSVEPDLVNALRNETQLGELSPIHHYHGLWWVYVCG